MNDVLRQQGRVEPRPLGADQKVAVAAVCGVRRIGRMVTGAVVSVDGCPDAESWCGHELARWRWRSQSLTWFEYCCHSLRAMAAKSCTDSVPRMSRIVSSWVAR